MYDADIFESDSTGSDLESVQTQQSQSDGPINQWKTLNFTDFQTTMNNNSNEIFKKVQESEISRKNLIEQTKSFRNQLTPETRKEIAGILKLYQSEVDKLTKRCKFSEGVFMEGFTRMSDLPDPVAIFENVKIENENKNNNNNNSSRNSKSDKRRIEKLEKEVQAYKTEMKDVRNQEVTINNLRSKLKEQEHLVNTKISSTVSDKTSQLEATHKLELENIQEQFKTYVEQNKKLQFDLDSAIAAKEKAQADLIESKNQFNTNVNVLQSQIELLGTDHERNFAEAWKNSQIVETKKGNENLNNDKLFEEKNTEISLLRKELTSKENEVSQLLKQSEIERANLKQENLKMNQELSQVKKQIVIIDQDRENLQNLLNQQSDYLEIKRQLNIFKSVELGENLSDLENSTSKEHESLEILVLRKNQNLKDNLSSLTLKYNQQEEKNIKLMSENEKLFQEREHHNITITKLETDLNEMISQNKQPLKPHFINGNASSLVNTNHNVINNPIPGATFNTTGSGDDSTSSHSTIGNNNIDSIIDIGKSENEKAVIIEIKQGNEKYQDTSMLEIVSGQRDRFRERNMQLEDEAEQLSNTNGSLKRELEELRGDNVKLYEKIKFLQSYQGQNMVQNRSGFDDNATESKYSGRYEEQINPFTEFHNREKHQRYNRLSTPEKATLSVTRIILGSKAARSFIFFYAVLLHVVILINLYVISHEDTQASDHDCAARFAQHMLSHSQGKKFLDPGHDHHH